MVLVVIWLCGGLGLSFIFASVVTFKIVNFACADCQFLKFHTFELSSISYF